MFGLGVQEILLLAVLGAIPLAVIVIVLVNQKKTRDED
jgi:hypothetical protein